MVILLLCEQIIDDGAGFKAGLVAELKLPSLHFGEAVRRKYATENPLAELGIQRETAPEKPTLTDEQIACIPEILAEDDPLVCTSRTRVAGSCYRCFKCISCSICLTASGSLSAPSALRPRFRQA